MTKRQFKAIFSSIWIAAIAAACQGVPRRLLPHSVGRGVPQVAGRQVDLCIQTGLFDTR